jgi:1,4-dihydroxy-2-naphthoate octaprenyltransferase
VATCGTAYVHVERVPAAAWWTAVPVGLLAVAILLANNVRDIPTDAATGKRTLAVRMGDGPSRALYRVVVVSAFAIVMLGVLLDGLPRATLLSLAAIPLAARPLRAVARARGPAMVPILLDTALLHLAFGLLLALGLSL